MEAEELRQEAAERAERKRQIAIEEAKLRAERTEKAAAAQVERQNRKQVVERSVGRKQEAIVTENRIELSQKRPAKEVEVSVGRSVGRPVETENQTMVGTVKTSIVGLSGELAMQNMGKRAKKRALD